MRCSKKTKSKYEIKMVDGLEYKKEIETPFCGLHQNLMKEDMMQEEKDKYIYQGEAPVKNESKKMKDLKNRLVKVHNALKLSDDPSDEDVIKTVEQLCIRMNKVELDRVRMYSSLRRMNKFMKKLPGVTEEYLENWEKELKEEANASYTGNQKVVDDIDVVKWKHMRFEDVAPKEMQEEVQRKRAEMAERHMANYITPEKAKELDKKYKEKEKEMLSNIESEGEVIVPTAKEVAKGSKTMWLGTGAAIMAEPDQPKVASVKDVGKNLRDNSANPLLKFEDETVDNNKGQIRDLEITQRIRERLRNNLIVIPFNNPDTDFLQGDLKHVIVKSYGKDKN
ncbi:hypothetical protein LPJ78_005688, partial [Coemansia sp. RSA 989]